MGLRRRGKSAHTIRRYQRRPFIFTTRRHHQPARGDLHARCGKFGFDKSEAELAAAGVQIAPGRLVVAARREYKWPSLIPSDRVRRFAASPQAHTAGSNAPLAIVD